MEPLHEGIPEAVSVVEGDDQTGGQNDRAEGNGDVVAGRELPLHVPRALLFLAEAPQLHGGGNGLDAGMISGISTLMEFFTRLCSLTFLPSSTPRAC